MAEHVHAGFSGGRGHRIRRMTGRDPGETHRAATPLELLFDLAFVAAFAQASNQLAHLISDNHIGPGIAAFSIATFAICLAWINFAWFASAFDCDDWIYRLMTMAQMLGVLVLALGMPDLFHSIEEGHQVDSRIIVAGYVVMRVALISQWLRVAKQAPNHRDTALTLAVVVLSAQVGWVILAILQVSPIAFFSCAILLGVVEIGGPIYAETRKSETPWHPHHIAERYGLLTIIVLGEGVMGTVAFVSALVETQGWSWETAIVGVAGTGLAFGLWWNYFMLPSGELLSKFRNRSLVWGFGHLLIFGSIAATGAGLHAAAYVIEGVAHIGVRGAVISVAAPVLIFTVALFALYSYLLNEFDRFHILLFVGNVLMLVLSVAVAVLGAPMGICLLLITAAPAIVVVGFETIGHRHQEAALERALA